MVARIGVVIPVRGQHELTRTILGQLQAMPDWHVAMVFNNGDDEETRRTLATARSDDRRLRFMDTPTDGIYQMWGRGLDWARFAGCDYVAFLNNDVRLYPGTFAHLARLLDNAPRAALAYPDYGETRPELRMGHTRVTHGTYRLGGMCGYAFMLRVDAVDWEPFIDPRFQWWGGDDDLAFQLEAKGWDQVRALGLPVAHMNEGTARHHPEVSEHKAADLAAVVAKWGR